MSQPTLSRRAFVQTTTMAVLAAPVIAKSAAAQSQDTQINSTIGEQNMSNSAVYSFQIGDIEASIISDGQIAFPAYPTYAPDQSEDEVHASMVAHGLNPPEYVLDANALLLRVSGRVILIDTGWGVFAPGVGRTVENLRSAGVDPSDIDTIVLSHIHPDHVGGLRDEAGGLNYRNAQVVVPAEDLAQWNDNPDFGSMAIDDGFRPVFVGAAQSVLNLGDQLEPAEDGTEVAPGINLVAAHGHTRGHSAVRITSGSAVFLYASDLFHDAAFDLANPDWRTAFDYDPAQAAASRRAFLEEAASEQATVMAYHMPFPGFGTVQRQGDGYAWRGTRWDVR